MKKIPTQASVGIMLLCLLHPVLAQAPNTENRSMPISIVLPPPRLEVRVPDVGPMQTREMAISAKISGLYAEVETTIVFHNPNVRELEGELIFPLPDGAAVCGYALDIQGVLVDGVIVTKERARVAFETETRRLVDPGLVEHVQGNLYRTRIYPLPAKGERRIRLTYITPLVTAPNGDAALSLPLPRESIAKLDVNIEVSTAADVTPEIGGLGDARFEKAEQIWRVTSSAKDSTPGEDILVSLPKLPVSFHKVERDTDGDNWFMISTVVPIANPPSAEHERMHVLWDASGSRAGADLGKEFALLEKTKASSYVLTVFRDIPEEPRDFATAEELIAAIKVVPYDGGTDIAALASFLRIKPAEDLSAHTLLFTDGFDTLSGQTLEFAGGSPVAIVSQTIANREALRQACAGALIDLQTMDAVAAWSEIESPSSRVSGVEGTGIAKVQGIGQAAHGRISLLGQLTAPEATVRILYADGSKSDAFVLRGEDAVEGGVMATAWASARVNQLTPRSTDFEDELLALGRKHGLVSPATSLIVLETLDQWVRHEIEPPATLPEMRKQWQQAMKSKVYEDSPDEAQRLEQLVALWQERVRWWNTDFSKVRSKPKYNKNRGIPEQRGEGEEGLNPQRAPAAPASGAADPFSDDEGILGGGSALHARKPQEKKNSSPESSITIKPWNPEVPYLNAILAAKQENRYAAYLEERTNWAESPAFFLDCATVFYQNDDKALGRRILSNLAELRVEDIALLRVFAWRLRQAEDLSLATVVLRRITQLRAEEPQSFRDLALVLADRGRATGSVADLEEAMKLMLQVALGNWNRHDNTVAIFAIEELNSLVAWVERKEWDADTKPKIPDFDKRLRQNLDTDIRIVMSWDADATDIDLHVLEPGGEEAYYGNNRTQKGGLVSQDITDGYGPEEYLVRIAPTGKYTISTNYFASRQQTVVGPATVTATVFTNWGRANEKRETLTLRLDKPKEKIEIGSISFGRGNPEAEAANLKLGLSREQIIAILGKPEDPAANPLKYTSDSKTLLLHFDDKKTLIRVTEILPGGTETIILQ